MILYNKLLSYAGKKTQIGRVSYWDSHDYGIRSSNRRGKPEAGLWFRTRGCHYDRKGGCIMCDYGNGPDDTSIDSMLLSVNRGLAELPEKLFHLLVSPIGSFFDEWEVPETARTGILQTLAETNHETFSFESRADTINRYNVKQMREFISRGIKIYMGLESANSWISKYCLNKGLRTGSFLNAVQTLNEYKINPIANVLIGAPFLTVHEIIDDGVNSVLWALAKGVSECNLFPVHVKKWTTIYWLFSQNLYKSPSLWTYIEVIRRLGENIACNQLELSWYKTYNSTNVVAPPTTCTKCRETVLNYLDFFDETNDYEWMYKLFNYSCDCKDLWKKQMEVETEEALPIRVIQGYNQIGTKLLPSKWWEFEKDDICKSIINDFQINDK